VSSPTRAPLASPAFLVTKIESGERQPSILEVYDYASVVGMDAPALGLLQRLHMDVQVCDANACGWWVGAGTISADVLTLRRHFGFSRTMRS
jgi:hypothetical protein